MQASQGRGLGPGARKGCCGQWEGRAGPPPVFLGLKAPCEALSIRLLRATGSPYCPVGSAATSTAQVTVQLIPCKASLWRLTPCCPQQPSRTRCEGRWHRLHQPRSLGRVPQGTACGDGGGTPGLQSGLLVATASAQGKPWCHCHVNLRSKASALWPPALPFLSGPPAHPSASPPTCPSMKLPLPPLYCAPAQGSLGGGSHHHSPPALSSALRAPSERAPHNFVPQRSCELPGCWAGSAGGSEVNCLVGPACKPCTSGHGLRRLY